MRGVRVLCVDDYQDVAVTLAGMLEAAGYEVRYALDGTAGLEAAREFHPHACLLDIFMPGLDGCELARRIRAELGGRVLLVALSALTGEEFDRRVHAAGFDLKFTKPADPAELLDVLAVAAPRALA